MAGVITTDSKLQVILRPEERLSHTLTEMQREIDFIHKN